MTTAPDHERYSRPADLRFARKIIRAAKANGATEIAVYVVALDDEREDSSQQESDLLDAMFCADDHSIHIKGPDGEWHWIRWIPNNGSAQESVCDHGVSEWLEGWLEPISEEMGE